MSKEKKKPKQNKAVKTQAMGTPVAAVEQASQPHNVKKEAQGPNTKR